MNLKIKNYQIIEECELDIDGITIISGQNGNGKSSLVRALRAACYGQLGNQFIRQGCKECSVDMDFGDGDVFRWVRDNKDITFYLNGEKYGKTKGKAPEEYENKLRIGKVGVTKTCDLRPNFNMQMDPLFLIHMSEVELANALSFLFSGDKFPALLKMISGDVKEAKKSLLFIEGQIEGKEKSLIESKERLSTYDKYEQFFNRRESLNVYISDLTRMSSYIENQRALSSDIAESTIKLSKITEKINLLSEINEERLTILENIAAEISAGLCYLDYCLKCQEKVSKTKESLLSVTMEISQLAESLSQCPFCGVELSEEDKNRLVEGVRCD